MKLANILMSVSAILAAVGAVPVNEPVDDGVDVPSEAVIGYMDFEGATDIAIAPFSNATNSGILFINTTIYDQAVAEKSLDKREAKWGWLRLRPGQPLYKREAEAEAKWGWLRLRPGQPLYKREAEAEAEAKWGWLRLRPGQPLYKREAEAEAEAKWGWLRLRPGQPLY